MTDKVFVSAVKRNSQRIYLIAFSYTKNHYDSQDIMQNCFYKLWKYDKSFDDDDSIDKWLTRVCINESKDFFKSFLRKKTTSLDDAVDVSHFDEYFNLDLFNAVQSLSKKERIVVHLFYYEDLPTKEISSLLGINDATVRSLLLRSRKKLKALLGDEWINE